MKTDLIDLLQIVSIGRSSLTCSYVFVPVKEPNVHVWRRAGAGDPGAGAGAGGEYRLQAIGCIDFTRLYLLILLGKNTIEYITWGHDSIEMRLVGSRLL